MRTVLTTLQTTEWQDRRDSNPQPLVLETSALPIELLSFARGSHDARAAAPGKERSHRAPPHRPMPSNYSMTFVTRPAPTVRPPSRMAKRCVSVIAIGVISSTVTLTLSPGMHISALFRMAEPVTSVVRK